MRPVGVERSKKPSFYKHMMPLASVQSQNVINSLSATKYLIIKKLYSTLPNTNYQ